MPALSTCSARQPHGRLAARIPAALSLQRLWQLWRRRFARLADLDRGVLADIVLEPADIRRGLALPLDCNASLFVHREARQRRRSERKAGLIL